MRGAGLSRVSCRVIVLLVTLRLFVRAFVGILGSEL